MRLKRWLGCVALLGCFAAQAEVQYPGAGSVGMEPPPGMIASARFSGFEDAEHGASILIAELPPEAYRAVETGFTSDALLKKGIVAGERGAWKGAGGEAGFLVRGVQTMQSVSYDKWLLVVDGKTATAVVTVQIPQSVDDYSDAAIQTALDSVRVRGAGSLDDQVAALPFRVGDLAGFRTVRTLLGSTLLLTDGPRDVVEDLGQPVIVIASGLSATVPTPEGRDAFARQGLNTLDEIDDVEIEQAQLLRLRDADWHRIEARATDVSTGEPVYVLQVVRFLPEGWIRVVATTAVDQRETWRERLIQLAESVEPNP